MKSKVVVILFLICSPFFQAQTATGFVFDDINKNGIKDHDEAGIDKICVSNGVEVVQTNSEGKWELPVTDDTGIFVIKPSNYSVPLNEKMVPQHYYLHKPNGSPNLEKEGVNPTGDLPESIDFPLYYNTEPKKFKTLLFGDTQASSPEEVHYINHDVVEELIGTDAKFGVGLGDIVGHDVNLFEEISDGISQIGIPWYYIYGNHDSNQDASENKYRDETFERFFGPSTYAFEYGDVSFVSFNNAFFNEKGKYSANFTLDQVAFLQNYLSNVPDNKLVVLMMHIPIFRCENKEKIFKILTKRSYTFSISGHVHDQVNIFVDEKFGWNGKAPHHHLINATVSGSWWCGLKDELGIPHATMNDGAPNGYSIVKFDGNQYSVEFRAARKPADYQMNIHTPDKIHIDSLDSTKVLVNVFAGSVKSKVVMKVGKNGKWQNMQSVVTIDPQNLRMHNLTPILKLKYNESLIEETLGWPMDKPHKSYHIWEGKLQSDHDIGAHTITVRTTDVYGQTYESNRIFYVYE